MARITEIIPDNYPSWVRDAIDEGQFFRLAVERVEKAESANKVLRESAERIKNLVVGDKLPNWGSNSATYHTRGIIADICDEALSHKEEQ